MTANSPGSPPINRRRLIPLALLLVTAITVIVYTNSMKDRVEIFELGAAEANPRPAPDFTLPDLDNNLVSLSDFRGKAVLLNFWASWCDPCRIETYAMETFLQRYGHLIVPVAVNMREPADTAERFRGLFGATYPILLDRQGKVSDMYRIQGVPENWFLDADGVARYHWPGALSFEEMQAAYQATTGVHIDTGKPGPVNAAAGQELHSAAALPAPEGTSTMQLMLLAGNGLHFTPAPQSAGWQQATGPEHPIALAGTPKEVFILNQDGSIWRWDGSTDLEPVAGPDPGVALEPPVVLAATYDGQDNTQLLVAAQSELWRWSEEAGWQALNHPPVSRVLGMAADPHQRGRILAGWAEGVMESLDGGHTWLPLALSATSPDPEDRIPWDARFRRPIWDVAFSQQRPGKVYYATSQGVWTSDNGGRFLTLLSTSPSRIIRSLTVISHDAGDRLLAAAPNGDLYISEDNGSNWMLYEP